MPEAIKKFEIFEEKNTIAQLLLLSEKNAIYLSGFSSIT